MNTSQNVRLDPRTESLSIIKELEKQLEILIQRKGYDFRNFIEFIKSHLHLNGSLSDVQNLENLKKFRKTFYKRVKGAHSDYMIGNNGKPYIKHHSHTRGVIPRNNYELPYRFSMPDVCKNDSEACKTYILSHEVEALPDVPTKFSVFVATDCFSHSGGSLDKWVSPHGQVQYNGSYCEYDYKPGQVITSFLSIHDIESLPIAVIDIECKPQSKNGDYHYTFPRYQNVPQTEGYIVTVEGKEYKFNSFGDMKSTLQFMDGECTYRKVSSQVTNKNSSNLYDYKPQRPVKSVSTFTEKNLLRVFIPQVEKVVWKQQFDDCGLKEIVTNMQTTCFQAQNISEKDFLSIKEKMEGKDQDQYSISLFGQDVPLYIKTEGEIKIEMAQ